MLDTLSFDPHMKSAPAMYELWLERLAKGDWTLDRNIFAYQSAFTPPEYYTGWLAEKWEQTDPTTVTIYLRQGIHWQNKAPVNGRELTANDVVVTWDSILGTGSGFTQPNPRIAPSLGTIDRVTAKDKNTVQFNLKRPGALALVQIFADPVFVLAPEWLDLAPKTPASSGPPAGGAPPSGGAAPVVGVENPQTDWHNAVGTGPWILTDFITGSSLTYAADPNYWGTDERYPDNKLPYCQELKLISIADASTAISALRTGKVDQLDRLDWRQAKTLGESNPEMIQFKSTGGAAAFQFRCDTAPFTDIRVRQALQMAIDLEAIAASIYGGTADPVPVGILSPSLKGWATPYAEWPQAMKDEYAFNPAKAKELLAEAGFPKGFKTNILANNMAPLDVMQAVKAMFLDVGVDMEIKVVDSGTFRTMTWDSNFDQMTYEGKAGMTWPPLASFMQRLSAATTVNLTLHKDTKFDDMVAMVEAATDLEEAKSLSREADMYCISQHWSANLCEGSNFSAIQPYLKGLSGESIGADVMARIWIDQSSKTTP